jgi:hypothetical protein
MDTKENDSVPYIAFESMMARQERHIRRLIFALVVAVLLIFISNLAWLYFFNQFEYSSEKTVTVDGKDGVANYIGNNGTITNGENSGEESPAND